jgi:hypothetical protein
MYRVEHSDKLFVPVVVDGLPKMRVATRSSNPDWIKYSFGLGPYKYFKTLENNEETRAFGEMLRKGEPYTTYGIDWDKLAKTENPLPCMWTHARPGPNEDPYLKEFYWPLPETDKIKYIFGFESIESVLSWFYEPELNKYMHEQGFVVVKYRSRHIRHGLRQSIMPCFKPYEAVRIFPLLQIMHPLAMEE